MKALPPLGDMSNTSRACSRMTGLTPGDREILCGQAAIRHVIFWWRLVQPGENPDDCWDHGFVCVRHAAELSERWTVAAVHDLTPACGMPGSRCHFEENTCTMDDLPVAEPDRVLAVGLEIR